MSDCDLEQDVPHCNSGLINDDEKAFLPWVFIQTGLPHGKQDDAHYTRENGKARLSITAGPEGMPFGKMPRLILAHLTAAHKRTGLRQIPLGHSQRGFLKALGMEGGGYNTRRLRDHAHRLFGAMIRAEDGTRQVRRALIADESRLWWEEGEDTEQLFPNFLTLSERFAEICERATPLKMKTYQGFRSSMAMDVYAWLSYRAPAARGPVRIPWTALGLQFGHNYSRPRAFREAFKKAMRQVLPHYPVRVDEVDIGIVVHPHAPDVPRTHQASPPQATAPKVEIDPSSDLARMLDDAKPKGRG